MPLTKCRTSDCCRTCELQAPPCIRSPEPMRFRRLVDDGLDAIGPPSLQVLLDTTVLVTKIHLDLGPWRKDPGREGLLGGLADLAGKDNRHLLGTADGDVVGDQGLEEPSGPARVVEDERPGHLDLAHGELPPIPGGPVLVAEGVGDYGDPAVEETLDVVRTERDRRWPGGERAWCRRQSRWPAR